MSNPLDEEVYGGRESSDSESIKQGNAGVAQSDYERAGAAAPDAPAEGNTRRDENASGATGHSTDRDSSSTGASGYSTHRDSSSTGATGNSTDRDIGEGAD